MAVVRISNDMEVITKDPVYLDNQNIRDTLKEIMLQDRLYAAERYRKRKMKHSKRKRLNKIKTLVAMV